MSMHRRRPFLLLVVLGLTASACKGEEPTPKLFDEDGTWSLVRYDLEGTGDLRYAQTRAFTTLVFFSMFTVFAGRSEKRSAFTDLFANQWLWGAVVLALALQVAVVYTPFLQRAFSTVGLGPGDWLLCAATGSSVLALTEVGKLGVRAWRHSRADR